MSKLTRSVIYINESDRPKKVEPLSFMEWMGKDYYVTKEELNQRVRQYATYLQEFSAEEKAVEFTFYFGINGRVENTHTIDDTDIVTFLGKCPTDGDMFCIKSDDGIIRIYSGKLNNGHY